MEDRLCQHQPVHDGRSDANLITRRDVPQEPAGGRAVQQQRIAGSTANRLFNRHDAQMVGGSAKLFAQSEKEGCA